MILAVLVAAVVVVALANALSLISPPSMPTQPGWVDLSPRAFQSTLTPDEPSASFALDSLWGPFLVDALAIGHVQITLFIDGEEAYLASTHHLAYGFPYETDQNRSLTLSLEMYLPTDEIRDQVVIVLYLAPWNRASMHPSANVGPGSTTYPSAPSLYSDWSPSNDSGQAIRLADWNLTSPPDLAGYVTDSVTARGWAWVVITPPAGFGCEWIVTNEAWPGYGSLIGGQANGSVAVHLHGGYGGNVLVTVGLIGPPAGATYAVTVDGPALPVAGH